jgi:ubiquinone/menaquinone biosynthesis C-methylase UbiE
LPVNDFGRVADIYDATRSLPEPEMVLLLEAMRRQIRGGPVIDVGVGTGRFALPLQRMGLEVVGIDLSRGMMAKAREKGTANLFYADVQQIPFRDRTFETALLVHILHLVSDWTKVVRESARVARETVMSAVETSDGTNLRDKYLELRKEMGYPLVRFEEGEKGLEGRVRPLSVTRVTETEREWTADEEIQHLLERGQSLTWDVPDETHQRIIGILRSTYGGQKLRMKGRIELVAWSSEQLRTADLGS